MWKKFLKCRGFAMQLMIMEIKNGKFTTFWHDSWSHSKRLKEVLGADNA